jgi:type I restriction enzyme M protein
MRADWGWVQHILASLKSGGRAAIVLDTGAVSRSSGSDGSNKERTIRKEFVERDFIKAVVLLPENLFYNATAPGIILLLHKNKPFDMFWGIMAISWRTLGDFGESYRLGCAYEIDPPNPEVAVRRVV